jgi:sulfite exporter TauE/SafE
MNLALDPLLAALAVGFATSLHCGGMCGPLSCAMLKPGPGTSPRTALALYHGMRTISYVLLGGLLGAIGKGVASTLSSDFTRALPWLLAGVLLVIGLGLERWIPQPKFFGTLLMRMKLHTLSAAKRLALLGFVTPLLPCGPLYLAFATALAAGTFLNGSLLMLAFAVGTIPLYAFLQTRYFALSQRWSPQTLLWLRRGVALVAAVLVAARAMNHQDIVTPGHCPMCHD